MALEAGPRGLKFYEQFARDLPRYLNPNGKVYFEIGTGMGDQVKNLFSSPVWKSCHITQDWSSHDRFVTLSIFLETE
jgi:release factor glutamine methyltransferase